MTSLCHFLLFSVLITYAESVDSIYDFIIVGSGTGGIVASRLAEQKHNVLLIEAGPDDLTFSCKYNNETCFSPPFGDFIAGTPLIARKGYWFWHSVHGLRWIDAISKPSYWNYNQTSLNHTFDLDRAKMLGGCLSHNGQAWSRGSVRDFDYISQKYKLSDWSFENVLPFYQKLESYFGDNQTFRGQNGPIHIIDTKPAKWQYKENAFLNVSIESGLKYNNHQNGDYPQTGIGFVQMNIANYEDGTVGLFNTTQYRSSSAQSYIREIGINSGYLTVWYNTTVRRILFDDNNSKTAIAIGVEYYDDNDLGNNSLSSIYCNKEVIISGGPYQSPQILILSGIGPEEELNAFNITPIYVNNNIGRYGQDHSYTDYRSQVNMSYFHNYNMTLTERPRNYSIQTAWNSTEYFDLPGAFVVYTSSNTYDRLGFDYNDIRIAVWNWNPNGDIASFRIDPAVYSKNLTVKLKSLDSRIYPDIYQNLYSDKRDYDQMIEGIFAVRKMLETNTNLFSLDVPFGVNVSNIDELRDWIWTTSGPAIHAVGTVSMGPNEIYNNESNSVYPVDTNCALRGVNNVRIVDTSIWPESTNSGTQSLAHMIGEKCAKHIIDQYKKDEENWWDKYQFYVIIPIVIVVISTIVVMIIGYKYYQQRKIRKSANPEKLQLIEK